MSMNLRSFETEEFYAKYEFTKPHQISVSDCETVDIAELIRLGGGTPDEFLRTRLNYPEMPGSPRLRTELAETYQGIREDQVLVLGAPIEGIYLALQALVKKGDHIVVLSPAYDALYNVAEHATGNVTRWFLKRQGQGWTLDWERLEEILKQPTQMIVVNFPHNPTGFLPTRAELDRLLAITRQKGIRIFSDEVYRGLEYRSEDRLPCVAQLDETAISLGAASKSLGLPGLRFGWLVTRDARAYKTLYEMKTYTTMCSTQAGEYLGLMAVRAMPQLVAKNLRIVEKNLQVAKQFFNKWQDRFEWIKPMAGPISMIKVKAGSAEKFCIDLADRHGVVLLPTRYMGSDDQHARLGLGRMNFENSMQAFDQALAGS